MRKEKNEVRWVELNNELHLRLYEPSGCRDCAPLSQASATRRAPNIHMFAAHDLPEHGADDDHQEILEACSARDVRRARRAIVAHINHTVNGPVRCIEENKSASQSH